MSRTWAGVVAGMIAGAVGATALNTVTFLDQAVRGRPSGNSPAETAAALADAASVDVPGDPDTARNRNEGFGSLAGLGVGVGVGALSGVLRSY